MYLCAYNLRSIYLLSANRVPAFVNVQVSRNPPVPTDTWFMLCATGPQNTPDVFNLELHPLLPKLTFFLRMASSGMLRRVALVTTDVSEELSASFIRVTRIGELGTTLVFLRSVRRLPVTAGVVPSSPILVTLKKEALSSSDTSVLTRATRRNIPEDAVLHSHRRENLKSFTFPCLL
jgi:hypothetical protein